MYLSNVDYWYAFWVLNFIVAGSAFAIIAVIVLIRGGADLRNMLRTLEQEGTHPPR